MVTKNTPVKLFDAHAHVLSKNVTHNVCLTAANPDEWNLIADQRECVFSIGFGHHPWYAHKNLCSSKLIDLLYAHPNSFVGEIGLDRTPKHKNTIEAQITIFTTQLKIAHDLLRPVAIHLVKASALGYDIIHKNYGPTVYLHGYICSIEELQRYPRAFFGFHERMHSNTRAQQMVQNLSLQQILIESDGVSDISSLEKTILWIANIKNISPYLVQEHTHQNTLRWLSID